MRVLVMGLPGSGKTTLADSLVLPFVRLNADQVRQEANDWDFTIEGRLRQARRMRELAGDKDVIADFVCPMPEMREIFDADYVVWMDTIRSSRFSDTNSVFIPPTKFNCCVTNFDNKFVHKILDDITRIQS